VLVDRKYDLLAISALMLSAILTAWAGVFGPSNTTTLKEWQPLMASILAIGGALIVYRGAKLAYTAAMAKIELDRELHEREAKRVTLGICLRLEHSLREFLLETREQSLSLPAFDSNREVVVRVSDFNLAVQSKLDEAWANLDRFPRSLSRAISELRGSYFDYKNMITINQMAEWSYGHLEKEPPETVRIREILTAIDANCVTALDEVRALSNSLAH
jgi:hypothetical protein